jgi:2,6-dihydroxypseudooxynicotine hydrolase
MTTHTFEDAMLNWGRLLLDGIPYADLREAAERDADTTWLDFWTQKSEYYERLGEEALAAQRSVSAGEWLWLASLCCQYAQFLWFDDGRAAVQRRKAELYARAAWYLRPPAERVEIPIDGTSIPGYLRVPLESGDRPLPCVVLIGGLESTKEESYLFENLLLNRGVATFAFDGPGQGEMLDDVPVVADFDRYTSKVLDFLADRQAVDPERVGVLGRSLGGLYALRSASMDSRFAACVSWGGFVVLDWSKEPSHDRASWRYVTKANTEEEACEYLERTLDIRPVLKQLRCPTYVLHGALDEIPLDQIDVIRQCATETDLTIVVEPNGDHCCHNLGPVPRVRMADWLADQLA